MRGSVQLQVGKTIESWNDQNIIAALKVKYESMILENEGVILLVLGNVDPTGTFLTDGQHKNYTVWFDSIIFSPKLLEVTLGEISSITNFGAYVRIGPLDAQLHLSQIFDGKAKVDFKSQTMTANNGDTLKQGNVIRGRITSIGLPKTGGILIGMDCKQPYLGKVK